MSHIQRLKEVFKENIEIHNNLILNSENSLFKNQSQTNAVFSEKWSNVNDKVKDRSKNIERQRNWYLNLYGFITEDNLKEFLSTKDVIFDAGCGLGEKSAWLASLSPNSLVVGMDFSEAALIAADKFKGVDNLFFVQGDIANTGFKDRSIDYVSCDQVIMHTENPESTFNHLSGLLSNEGVFSCYVYKKKAMPRELLDTFFRSKTHELNHEELWRFAKQMTELGKQFSELNVKINAPDIPLLGIKGGEYDLQRFIHWNLMKCFWNENLGIDSSIANNFDWYSPSNAKTYSKEMFLSMVNENNLEIKFFNEEEACFSGRFDR